MPHEFDGPGYWGRDEFELWETVSRGYPELENDRTAANMFSAGWLEDAPDPEMRQAVRNAYFDYVIAEGFYDDRGDFDWQAWREYMGYR